MATVKVRREKLHMREVRSSDLIGFIRRLRKLGFELDVRWSKNYSVRGSPYRYIRTYWRLQNGNQRVLFKLSRHGYSMIVWRNGREKLRQTVPSINWLEKPFLRYFDQEVPLCLRRLGRQRKIINQWLKNHPDSPQAKLSRAPIRYATPNAGRSRPLFNAGNKPPATK